MDSFLQSKFWADFQKSLGRKVWQINEINIIKHNLPFGKSYLYSPRCGRSFLSEDFLKKIKEIAGKENAIFLKIEPLRQSQGKPFRKSNNIQPDRTLVLDISKPEQELLIRMHYKTRYNIQLAQKKNIDIKHGKQYLEDFLRLIEQTSKRDKFRPHPKEYYRKMLEIPGVELFVALIPPSAERATPEVVAANIMVFYAPRRGSGQAIYLHGASDYKYRNLMAPHLLQWEQIKEAKKRGCAEYDFWGIDEQKWLGVTRFKKGFGGQEVIYLGAYDLIFQPIWYKIYKITGIGNRVLTKLMDMISLY